MTETKTACTLKWADGEYTFCLKPKVLRELQDKCKAGPGEISNRLRLDTWRIDDIRETVRLGLIGGGMMPGDALKLVERYVDSRPWMENRQTAQIILLAVLVGLQDGGEIGEVPIEEFLSSAHSVQ